MTNQLARYISLAISSQQELFTDLSGLLKFISIDVKAYNSVEYHRGLRSAFEFVTQFQSATERLTGFGSSDTFRCKQRVTQGKLKLQFLLVALQARRQLRQLVERGSQMATGLDERKPFPSLASCLYPIVDCKTQFASLRKMVGNNFRCATTSPVDFVA